MQGQTRDPLKETSHKVWKDRFRRTFYLAVAPGDCPWFIEFIPEEACQPSESLERLFKLNHIASTITLRKRRTFTLPHPRSVYKNI